MKTLAISIALAGLVSACPSSAQVTIYTDQALFQSQRPGYAETSLGTFATRPSYGTTIGVAGVTFYNPVRFGAFAQGDSSSFVGRPGFIYDANPGVATTISFGGPALGLALGFNTAGTLNYTVNGVSGSLVTSGAPATYFLGFDTGSAAGPLAITFSDTDSQIAFLTVITAVPEPAAWAMAIVGLGIVGGAMRRRRTIAARIVFA